MDSPERDALVQALITEAVSLAVMLGLLWALSHKTELEHAWWKAHRRSAWRAQAGERALREVRSEISRMEHPEG